ncbi:hypothetical protein QBC38DRAFT_452042 [Podospora fimiseda]|uniref:DUF7905 domain-containing protein n=1 Tax=Podospora fimiseda TaxID=252190 RepID=A0AAN7BWI6_9PEZI|nr:hypothetical protein QBC38DRAFT_452042 [Podospora fimiseda]
MLPLSANSYLTMQMANKGIQAAASGRSRVLLWQPQPCYTAYLATEGDDDDGLIDIDPGSFDFKSQLEMLGNESAKIKAVEISDGASELQVRSGLKQTATAAVQNVGGLVRHMIRCSQGPDVWKPIALVNAVDDKELRPTAILQSVHTDGSRRPVAKLSRQYPAKNPGYMDALNQALDHAIANLQYDPNRLHMKVNFGQIALSQWNKTKVDYTFPELEKTLQVAGERDCVSLTGRVPMAPVEALRLALEKRDKSLPEVVLDSLEVSKPEFNLYVFSKNLAIQCPLEPVYVKERHGFNNKVNHRMTKKFMIGTLTGHQMDRTVKKINIITACPESSYDWELEVTREVKRPEAQAVLPFVSKALESFTIFTGEILQGEFPAVRIMDSFIQKHDISNIYGKSTWTYQLSMQYTLEISIFHVWGNNTSAPPETTATVSLFSGDWEDQMAVPRRLPREWENSFAHQFTKPWDEDEIPEPSSCKGHPLSHFISWVHWVQKILDGMQPVKNN